MGDRACVYGAVGLARPLTQMLQAYMLTSLVHQWRGV